MYVLLSQHGRHLPFWTNGFTAAASPLCFSVWLQGQVSAQALPSAAFTQTEIVSSDKVMGVVEILQEKRRKTAISSQDAGLKGSEAAVA